MCIAGDPQRPGADPQRQQGRQGWARAWARQGPRHRQQGQQHRRAVGCSRGVRGGQRERGTHRMGGAGWGGVWRRQVGVRLRCWLRVLGLVAPAQLPEAVVFAFTMHDCIPSCVSNQRGSHCMLGATWLYMLPASRQRGQRRVWVARGATISCLDHSLSLRDLCHVCVVCLLHCVPQGRTWRAWGQQEAKA